MVRQLEPLERLLGPSPAIATVSGTGTTGKTNLEPFQLESWGPVSSTASRQHQHPPADHSSALPGEQGGWFIVPCQWGFCAHAGRGISRTSGEMAKIGRGKAMSWAMLLKQHLHPPALLIPYGRDKPSQEKRGWTEEPPDPSIHLQASQSSRS